MISWIGLSLTYLTLGILIYVIVRNRGDRTKTWYWFAANAASWAFYGPVADFDGSDSAWWPMIYGFLFGLQATNAVIGYAMARRKEEESK